MDKKWSPSNYYYLCSKFSRGKNFDGYKNCWYQSDVIDGINVIRVKTYIAANEGFTKRIMDYMSFMVTGFIAGLFKRNLMLLSQHPAVFLRLCRVGIVSHP
ncbi:hypothetical protein OIU89_26890 [Escherichia coli]|nr:hypothetical protein [Escherichia coli]